MYALHDHDSLGTCTPDTRKVPCLHLVYHTFARMTTGELGVFGRMPLRIVRRHSFSACEYLVPVPGTPVYSTASTAAVLGTGTVMTDRNVLVVLQ